MPQSLELRLLGDSQISAALIQLSERWGARYVNEFTAAVVRNDSSRLRILLRREGWAMNKKYIYRLHSTENPAIRSKHPMQQRPWRYRSGLPTAGRLNEIHTVDFISDKLLSLRSQSWKND